MTPISLQIKSRLLIRAHKPLNDPSQTFSPTSPHATHDTVQFSSVTQLCPTVCDPMDCSLPESSMEFFRQEYWRGLPFPFPGDLPNPEIEPGFLALQADSLPSEPSRKAPKICSSVHGTLQAGILEWVILFPSLGDPPVTEIEPRSPAL